MVEKEVVLRGYEDIADVYTEKRAPSDAEREAMTSFLGNLSPESRVLDAGCGGGKPVLQELSNQSQAIGLDFSSQQLKKAQSNAPDARVLRGDMARLPVADRTVDAVLAYHSLIHLPAGEHQAVLDEFARVLRPSGQLLLSEGPGEWEGTNPDWLHTDTEMQWHIAGAEKTRSQLKNAGFRIDTEYGAPNTLANDEKASWVFFDATLDRT